MPSDDSASLLFMRDRIYYNAYDAITRPSICPSVRTSVTRVDQSKTAELRIMQFSPYSTPRPSTFCGISFIQNF